MMKSAREVLEGLLRVIAGASQIAIDRGADSGVIDFKGIIDQALLELQALVPKEKEIPSNKDICLASPDENYNEGYNQALADCREALGGVRCADKM